MAKTIHIGLVLAGLLSPGAASAASDEVDVSIAIQNHVFMPAELKVPAGKTIVVTVDNRDPTPEEFESPTLKVEKIIAGASKGLVRFGPLSAGTYDFFGDFNRATAQGKVTAE
jgi:plastocyanin